MAVFAFAYTPVATCLAAATSPNRERPDSRHSGGPHGLAPGLHNEAHLDIQRYSFSPRTEPTSPPVGGVGSPLFPHFRRDAGGRIVYPR